VNGFQAGRVRIVQDGVLLSEGPDGRVSLADIFRAQIFRIRQQG